MDWLAEHRGLVELLVAGSLVAFVASLVCVPIVVTLLPVDYFASEDPPPLRWQSEHRVLRLVLLVLRNTFGAILILCGIAMLVLPGQGLIAIALGLGLMVFPGKRRLELAIVRRRAVHGSLNWLRRRAGREPLRVNGVPPEA